MTSTRSYMNHCNAQRVNDDFNAVLLQLALANGCHWPSTRLTLNEYLADYSGYLGDTDQWIKLPTHATDNHLGDSVS